MNIEIFQKRRLFFLKYAARKPVAKNKNANIFFKENEKKKDGERKKYDVVGKVLAVKELENRRGMFEHRVQYYNLDVNTREEIIRFIFEEERKSRKKERLN